MAYGELLAHLRVLLAARLEVSSLIELLGDRDGLPHASEDALVDGQLRETAVGL